MGDDRAGPDADLAAKADAVRRALDAGHQPTDIERVVPLIVPRNYFELGNWPRPYAHLRSPLLGLTWTVLYPDAMVYVNWERAKGWEREGIDWRERAMANLRALSAESLLTHARYDDDDQLLWGAMLHEDGIGSSRLLLHDDILAELGGTYRIGLPDRSCAIVIPVSAGEPNMAETAVMIRQMYEGATVDMLPDLLDPEDLEVVG
jgi:hypothetical protein